MSTRSLPIWKDDFPISWVDDHYVTRREFTKSLALVSCAAFSANAALVGLGSLRPPAGSGPQPRVRVAGVNDMPAGGARVFTYGGSPCLLVRITPERFVAFGQQCTHLGCPVLYRPDQKIFHCPCHEGYFDGETGRVIAGPPPRPLPAVEIERNGDDLWATGVRR